MNPVPPLQIKDLGRRLRLGADESAYLRALIEGVSRDEAAARYLRRAAVSIERMSRRHEAVVDTARALARRAGLKHSELLGRGLGARQSKPEPVASKPALPTLDEWVRERGLEDWSQAEQREWYEQEFGTATKPAPSPAVALASSPAAAAARKRRLAAQRADRRRRAALATLAEIERVGCEAPSPTDRLSAWLVPDDAARLERAGMLLLADLASAVARRKRWWASVPGIGRTKAERIAATAAELLGPAWPRAQAGAIVPVGEDAGDWTQVLRARLGPELSGAVAGRNRAGAEPAIDAADDLAAIGAWIRAKAAASPGTARAYRREAVRWVLWCVMERRKAISAANAEDCAAYMEFLQDIPARWIGAGAGRQFGAYWAPFKGELQASSRMQAVKILGLLHEWLCGSSALYLASNPWGAVNTAAVLKGAKRTARGSRALTPAAYEALRDDARAASEGAPGRRERAAWRTQFVVEFLRFTGLRLAELQAAKVADIEDGEFGPMLHVVGKGQKPREVTLPDPALAALDAYLARRDLPGWRVIVDSEVRKSPEPREAPKTPLLEPVGDSALRRALKRQAGKALARLGHAGAAARASLVAASPHRLRHTMATRAAEAGVPVDVLQAELGHADASTTAGYYTAQKARRVKYMRKAAALEGEGGV